MAAQIYSTARLKMAPATKQNLFRGRLGLHSREIKAEMAEI
jgi:hypothetical protein